MNAEGCNLLNNAASSPEDDHTRLVLADWLEDHDDPRCHALRQLGHWIFEKQWGWEYKDLQLEKKCWLPECQAPRPECNGCPYAPLYEPDTEHTRFYLSAKFVHIRGRWHCRVCSVLQARADGVKSNLSRSWDYSVPSLETPCHQES